jgi:integrase
MLLAEWWAIWVPGRQVRPTTAERDDAIWRHHIAPSLGGVQLGRLRRSELAAWVAGLSVGGLAPATASRCLTVLKACLSAAVDDGRLAANPATRLSVQAGGGRSEQRFLSAAELAALEAAMGSHWSLVVPFAAATGLRIGELAALRVSHLRLAAGEVLVEGTATEVTGRAGGRWAVTPPKSRAGRRVVPTIYPALARRMADHVAGRGPDDWLFAGADGGPLRATNWRSRVWRPAVAQAGLEPPPTPHALRHTAIAAWIAAGAGRYEVSRWAGHSSPSTTERLYGHLWATDHSGTRAALGELLAGRAPVVAMTGRRQDARHLG